MLNPSVIVFLLCSCKDAVFGNWALDGFSRLARISTQLLNHLSVVQKSSHLNAHFPFVLCELAHFPTQA